MVIGVHFGLFTNYLVQEFKQESESIQRAFFITQCLLYVDSIYITRICDSYNNDFKLRNNLKHCFKYQTVSTFDENITESQCVFCQTKMHIKTFLYWCEFPGICYFVSYFLIQYQPCYRSTCFSVIQVLVEFRISMIKSQGGTVS